jgi:hypothetical protein
MRISSLLLLLSGLLMAGVVPARGQAPSDLLPLNSSQAKWVSPSTKLDLSSVDDVAVNESRLRWDESLRRFTIDNVQPAQDQVCYTMRSYKVERTERVDDSTQPMQYSTCQPSSGFDVKNADVHVVEPEGSQP